MGGSCHRSANIATVVSRVLHAASMCAPIVLLGAPTTLTQASESKALAADIPAQPLAQALAVFRRQTGLQLIYVSSVISNQRSQAVAAGLNADEALARLLQGTGLRFEHLTPRSIRIFAGVVAPRATAPRVLTGPVRDEVIISASRGSEKLQDVPITIQSIAGDQLKQLNVTTTNDLLKYTTNVTFSGNGPGTGNIFIRGLGGSGTGNQSQSTTAPFPNVALYLDDQSMQFPARNNDVYLVDMERVEVLEGPQGTLFGGGALAGVIRYITNKPQLEATSGEVNAGYGITAGGDPNTSLNAVLNVPLIDNVFGLRGVIFSDTRGGYIDNVPGTIGYHPGTPPYDLGGNPVANNGPVRGNNLNKVTYTGARLSALWQINDNWDALLQQNYQNMEVDGYFYAYPTSTDGQALGRYQISAFAPAYSKDNYESTAWRLNGKVTDLLSILYSGSYMVRHIDGQQDYSNYLRNAVGFYYACIGTGAGYFNDANFPNQLAGHKLQCSTSVGNWRDQVRNTHQSHELSLTTNADNRIRGLAGFYWEKFVIDDNMNFNYLGIPQCDQANLNKALNSPDGSADCLSAVGPLPGTFATSPGLRTDANTAFGEDVQRGYKQKAFFTSIDVDIIPKVLTATGGLRFYHYDEFEEGSEYYNASTSGAFSNGVATPGGGLVVNHLNGQCTAAGLCGFPINLEKSESGHRSRGNLTWHVTDDIMSYYTYSEGLRPGGFNRATSLPGQPPVLRGVAPYSTPLTQQYGIPAGYNSDSLINNEVGFKSEFLDHHVLFNLSVYYMKWENIQQLLFDQVNLGINGFNVNGSSYTVKGFEVQFVARITDGLSVQGSSSINTLSQSSTPCLTSVGVDPNTRRTEHNPTPKGRCITQVNGAPYTNPFGQLGTRPPFAPPWMFNLRARYDWAAGAFKPFAWLGASHIASMSNEPANFPDGNSPSANPPTGWPTTALLRYQIPAYTTYDGGLGVAKANWTAQIQGNNLSNAYGPTKTSSDQFIKAEIPLRPRVITFLIGYRF
jgi:iron complex outermembrane receptor protein